MLSGRLRRFVKWPLYWISSPGRPGSGSPRLKNVVPGDLILIRAGKVPADARLSEAFNLQIEEAALTGESVPSEKDLYQHCLQKT